MDSPTELTAASLWTEISARLQGTLNETTYSTWFGDARGIELEGESFILAVPNDFTRDWIEGHFLGLINAALEDTTGRELRISLRVEEASAAVPEGEPERQSVPSPRRPGRRRSRGRCPSRSRHP